MRHFLSSLLCPCTDYPCFTMQHCKAAIRYLSRFQYKTIPYERFPFFTDPAGSGRMVRDHHSVLQRVSGIDKLFNP
jgi:hypothetical protein